MAKNPMPSNADLPEPDLAAFERYDQHRAEETGYDRIVTALESHGSQRRDDSDTNGDNEMWLCPAHDDVKASLSIKRAEDRVLLHCHAGCSTDTVLDGLGLQRGALFDDRYAYHYTDRDGTRVKTKHREPGKRFWQSGDTERGILYRLPEVWRAVEEGRDVWLTEGEKDVLTLEILDEVATTTGGVSSLAHADLTPLHGAKVKAVIDKDQGGDRWAQGVLAALDGLAESLQFFEAATGKDVTDHITAGLTLADLVPMVPARPSEFEQEVERDLRKALVREAVQTRLAALRSTELPNSMRLTDLLAEPDQPVRYRIENLWPSEGRVLLAAQAKAGKTTIVGNVIRCLADDEPLLDTYFVEPADRIALIDNEMSREQMKTWLRAQGIKKTDAIDVFTLRGKVSSFNLLDPAQKSLWAKQIEGADVLIVDCLRPILDALGLSESNEAGRFLVALDELADEAGVKEVLLVHHMGHGEERSRGDSRLLDWPDANWEITRVDKADKASPRFLTAWGRDVEEPEVELVFDPETRHLSAGLGTRRQAKQQGADAAVLAYVAANPGQKTGDVRQAVKVPGREAQAQVGEAIRRLRLSGALVQVKVPGSNARPLYLATDAPPGAVVVPVA